MPVREGSEEYLNSEKYETWERKLDGPLLPAIRRLNEIRRENPALQVLDNVHFLDTHNDAIVAYVKHVARQHDHRRRHRSTRSASRRARRSSRPSSACRPCSRSRTCFTGEHFDWRIGGNYVRMEAGQRQAHVLRVVG